MERERFSLNRDWRFHLGEIVNETQVDHGIIYGTAKAGACRGVPQADYDVSEWEKVDLPHDWSIHLPFEEKNVPDWGYKARGKGWYRRSFALPVEAKDKKIVLGFEGVSTRCTVYLNGIEICQNHSGYTPFEMDITDIVFFGNVPNNLAVYVDASIWEGWWYEGAGIYRNVWLEMMNTTHICHDSLFLNPKKLENGDFQVTLEADICNDGDEDVTADIFCYLTSPKGKRGCVWEKRGQIIPQGNHKIQGDFLQKNPKLWDIEEPNLYTVEMEVAIQGEKVDALSTVCGFRTIVIDAQKGFLLNGRPVKILGTCNHQDFGGLGVAVPSNLWEYKIDQLKKMGSNAYRCAHGMPADELLDACDRMGMLVLDENRNFTTSRNGIEQLETLVKRHRNHPSVIMYSIFNEEPLEGTLQGMRMAKRMRKTIESLDSSRFITGAMHGGMLEEENAAVALDVAGVNYQIPIYDAFHEKHPDMPMIATETTSTFSIRGCYEKDDSKNLLPCYDDTTADWGNTVRDTWKAIMERDFVSGGFMWTGFDYLGEPTPHIWPSVSSFFGLLDTCGFEKDGFYLAKAIFSKEPVCHVLPHWNHKGKEGEMIRVMSHTNCEEAELFVNGESFGRKIVDLFTQCEWMVPYVPGEICLKGYQDGKEVASDVKKTTGECRNLRLTSWHTEVLANDEDAALITIEAVDENGCVIPDCNLMTHITVEGGKLLGSCNGNPNCHEPFDGNKRSIFHGKCMTVVRPNRSADKLTVTVRAELSNPIEGFRMELEELCEKDTDTFLQKSISLPVVSAEEARELLPVQEMALSHWKISPLYEERPDVMQKIQDYDMNSWQDVHVDKESGSPEILKEVKGKYAIYQTQVQIPKSINGHLPELYFYNVWGACEVYINGEKRDSFAYEWAIPHSISLREEDCTRTEIRILVKSINIFGAGLNSNVVLR